MKNETKENERKNIYIYQKKNQNNLYTHIYLTLYTHKIYIEIYVKS